MSEFADFHFLRPLWLLALLPLAALLWRMARQRLGGGAWESVCDSHLLPFVLMSRPTRRRPWPVVALAAGALLAIIALAGPAWERLPQPVFRTESALVIALDLSRSMDATDIKPSRLARARFKIADILTRREEGQTALVVYAQDAFTVTPLTDDGATITAQLPALTTDIMPRQGSRTGPALRKARTLLEQAGLQTGDVLLVTDGQGTDSAGAAVRELRDAGFRLSVIGVGSPEGAPIPMPGGGFVTDSRGGIVVPQLEEDALRRLASLGDGHYSLLTVDDSDLERVLPRLDRLAGVEDNASLAADIWREQGPWLILLLLPLAALGFRRGLLSLMILGMLPWPGDALAFDLSSLFLRPDQQASRALERGDAAAAAELFGDPAWKGAAHYRAKAYEEALEAMQGLEDSRSRYNRGNALAQLGRYPEAIEQYEQALKLDPENEDARYNRELLKQLLEQQNSQPQQQQESDNQESGAGEQSPQSESSGSGEDPGAEQPAQGESRDAQAGDEHQSQDQPDKQEKNDEERGAEQQAEASFADEAPTSKEEERLSASAEDTNLDESEQAAEQWLREIPDDPAGLLRRKFLYQYRQQAQSDRQRVEQPW